MAAYLTLAPIVAGAAMLVLAVWAGRGRLAEARVPVRARDPRRR
ncbi:MAG TPA: hypothetical protein VFD49_16765 [Candidatus Dormibacteraeota bacterium]|nr:hypothetical protein [Candidatus Dormibacteraeota bacterium]